MLAELCDYARREKLAGAPGFQRKPVTWLISIDTSGHLIGDIQSTKELIGKRLVSKEFEVPAQSVRSVNVKAYHLVDKRAYVLGGPSKRNQECHVAYVADLRKIVDATGDPGLEAQLRFLERWDRGEFVDKIPPDVADSDLFGFQLHPGGELLFTPSRETIARYFGSEPHSPTMKPRQCLVCGRNAPAQRLHAKIKGVPGSTQGSLVSTNAPAFESFGFVQGDASPVCEPCAETYAKALNALLKEQQSHFRLDDSSVIVFWNTGTPANDMWDVLDAKPDAVRHLLESPLRGTQQTATDISRFYAAVLTASKGRVTVRTWIDQTLPSTYHALRRHFEDTEILSGGTSRTYSLSHLLKALTPLREKKRTVSGPLEGAFVRAVFSGAAYPRETIQMAVMRFRAEGFNRDRETTAQRVALIKATLRRLPELKGKKGISTSMDVTNKDPAYLCGRLFALLEASQRRAGGDVNATIADRYYGSASATPAAVFGTLLRLNQHHLSKARHGEWLKGQIGDVIDLLPATFPTTLNVQAQGIFAIGYYQQREALFNRQDKEDAAS